MARIRKPRSQAVIKITIERSETVWKRSRDWRMVRDEATETGGKYEYVDAVLPKEERSTLLEQSLPESKLDMAKIIKAINSL